MRKRRRKRREEGWKERKGMGGREEHATNIEIFDGQKLSSQTCKELLQISKARMIKKKAI